MAIIETPPGDAYQRVDQFILFGDSITQFSYNQHLGFGLSGALQDGQYCFSFLLSFCGDECKMLTQS